jgi:hypothetical protein
MKSKYDNMVGRSSNDDVRQKVATPIEDAMSQAKWLADIEVAVTSNTPDSLDPIHPTHGVPMPDGSSATDEECADVLRSANDYERELIWNEWVKKFGAEEASRRWLSIFAATDAPRTG